MPHSLLLRSALPALLALLLSACGALPAPAPSLRESLAALPGESWTAEVEGVKVAYHVVDLGAFDALGYTAYDGAAGICNIYIDTWLAGRTTGHYLPTVYHEVGHCLDHGLLGYSHNGFRDEGCAYGPGYCPPAEGYAETWEKEAMARCGYNAFAVGYRSSYTFPCALPGPRDATPSFALRYRTR